jgi:hypothetical protein
MKSFIPVSLALSVLAVLALVPAGASMGALERPSEPTAAPIDLSDADLERLSAAALGIRTTLQELRNLPQDPQVRTPATQVQIRALHKRLDHHLDSFLEVSGLSRRDFVRLVDEGNIDADEVPAKAALPELRPLTQAHP